jgi:hypothetical protein
MLTLQYTASLSHYPHTSLITTPEVTQRNQWRRLCTCLTSCRLWLISKEAADRLAEFEPCDMVLLLDAVAGMCVADDALCRGVAEAVAAKRDAYSGPQLAEVGRSLQRMGYTGQV